MSQVSPEVEYQERWNYVRHLEDSRRKAIQLFFLVIGGSGSYLTATGIGPNVISHLLLFFLLSILVMYAICLLALLAAQEEERQRHFARIDELDETSTGEEMRGRSFKGSYVGVMATSMALVTLLSAGAVVTISMAYVGASHWSELDGDTVLGGL